MAKGLGCLASTTRTALSPSPQYGKVLEQYQHQFICLDSAGRVRPMTSAADELGLLLVLLNPPRTGEGCVCAYGGIVDVISGTPLAVGVEIDRVLKILERRARLYGLDAPTKIAPTRPDGQTVWQPE
jgi:hypothetical protein